MIEVGRPCYHAITFGWLTDGAVAARARRARSAELVDEVLAVPLGLDLRIGLGDDASAAGRLARLRPSRRLPAERAHRSRSRPPARPGLRQPADLSRHRGRLVAAVAGAGRQRACHRAGDGRAVRRAGDRAGGGHADAGAGAASRPPRATTRCRGGRFGSGRPATSCRARPAGWGRRRTRSGTREPAAPATVAGRSFGPGSRSSPPSCDTRTATAARPRCWTCCTGACMADRPNILLVMADQLGACHLPCLRASAGAGAQPEPAGRPAARCSSRPTARRRCARRRGRRC